MLSIPKGWQSLTIEDACTLSSGTTPARDQYDRYYKNGTVHWVKTLDLNNSVLRSTEECVTEKALEETSLKVYPPGTVLVAMYGGYNQIGRTGLLEISAAVNQAITALQPAPSKINSSYLLAYLNYKIDYWKTVASSSRKDPNITSADVRTFPIVCPPIEEQRAIAAALSDMDALLAKLDQLIAKKRGVKQAAMQELLTGRRRLPGFNGEARSVHLGEIGKISSGSGFPTKHQGKTEGNYPFYKVSDMNNVGNEIYMTSANHRISADVLVAIGAKLFEPCSIIFAKVGAAIFLERKKILTEASCLDNNLAALTINTTQADYRYIHHTLLPTKFSDLVNTTALPSLSGKEISSIKIHLPPLDEQREIAEVLNDMDTEITALEARREKTRLIKQGMMQELLSGRVRLI